MKWQGCYGKETRLGQISILMMFSLIPMFTLIAFVINIGMLVNAKISLQNAVDAAAYAGAATQARQMTDISHLNYYMRMVYKKFIFKYYVLGNVSQKCFPKKNKMDPNACNDIKPDDSKAFDWINRDSSGGNKGFPGIPTVCISLSKESNPCQVAAFVPVVQRPKCGAVDPACAALQAAADAISGIQLTSCQKGSQVNQEVLGMWLYATDYDSTLRNNANLQGLISDDIGLMPEELMLYERINNISDIINTPGNPQVTVASATAMRSGKNTWSNARTMLAFESLSNNLNRNVFIDDSIEMSELLSPSMLILNKLEIPDIEVGITFMEQDSAGNCGMNIDFFKADVITGVSKSKLSHVYYAVKGTAKAKILFNPFPFGSSPAEGITLSAYAAAMPFGSRIGPDLSSKEKAKDEFAFDGTARQATAPNTFTPRAVRYPRVKIDDAGHDSQSSDVLAGFFAALATDDTTTQGGNSLGTLGSAGLAKGLHAAMIPDEYELGQYNIPVDSDTVGGQPGQAGFSPYFADNDRASYSIWAPYTGVGSKPNGYTDAMNGEIDKITQLANLGTGVMADGKTQLKSDLVTGMGSVNSTLLKRNGFNVFQMPDPLSTAFYQNNTPPIIPGKVTTKWGTTPATAGQFIATSWTTDHDANYFNNGRDGYSVKMIPLRLLLSQPGKLTNDPSGQANWVPVSGGFGGERPDMQKTAH